MFNYNNVAESHVRYEQPGVIVIGNPRQSGYQALIEGLQQYNRPIACHEHCAELQEAALAKAALVFIVIGGFSDPALRLQTETLIRRARHVSVVPIIEYAEQDRAAALLESGCVDYLLAPFSPAQVHALLLRQEAAVAAQEIFVACSHASRRLLAMAQRVAVARAPILITGETGTGKEMLARYIHRFAGNDKAPFIAVNCAAIPEQMLESLLFGHERGAFTGAVAAQPGKFEQANGGTLLLDEIGELPLGLQAKLLRVLQERRVERLGATRETPLDVRVIAATNRDLSAEVAQGRFRADLMFRLDVLALHIAPLRERPEDVLALARRFITRHAPHEHDQCLLTPATCQALLQHTWPGNVRELENTLQRALVLRRGLFIQPHDLGPGVCPEPVAAVAAPEGKAALRATGKWAEHQHVLDTLSRFDGNKSKAAQSLGMTSRALRYRLSAMREQGVPMPLL